MIATPLCTALQRYGVKGSNPMFVDTLCDPLMVLLNLGFHCVCLMYVCIFLMWEMSLKNVPAFVEEMTCTF